MYKKISNYVVVVIFSAVCGFVLAMEQDRPVRELLHQGFISPLSVNDYIVPVSSAYQALLKEACFKQYMLRDMINTVNTAFKEKIAGRGGIVHQLSDDRMAERLIDPNTSYLRIPCFRYMELTYKNAEKSECRDDMDAQVKIITFYYYIAPRAFNSREYVRKEKSLMKVSAIVKNNIMHLLPNGKSAYIELYAPDQISDFIKITNCFKATSRAVCSHVARQEQEQSLFHAGDMDYRSLVDSPFEVDMKLCSFIVGATIIAVMLVGGVLY